MKAADTTRKFLAVCLVAGFSSASQVSTCFAQEYGVVGTWRTMIGSPSTYGQPSASVVFTTAFAPDGAYRTTAVVEGGDGEQGAGGTYFMAGHYEFRAPSMLQYRLESSMLCVAVDFCSPSTPPGGSLGVVVSVELQFNGSSSFLANGQPWTRLQ
jgi:hypothetical protein